jgi:hypothetical protein
VIFTSFADIRQTAKIRQTFTRFAPAGIASLFCVFLLSGCLTAENKEVHLRLNPDGRTGSGTILFSNIMSSPGDTTDVSQEDFNSLIAEYYQGRKLEMENKGMKNVRKKLFKQDGKLMGEVEFDFDDLTSLGIFRYKETGPYMYYTVGDGFFTSGQYVSSNGSYMGERMPIIVWDPTAKELYYTMQLTTPQEVHKPLIAQFESWQANQK